MKSASAALIAFLDQPDLAFYGADIYTFTLQNGTVFRASTIDRPISYSGAIYPVARAAVNQQYAITGITQASIAVLTIDGHPFTVGDPFQVTGVSGMTQINGLQGYVTFVTPNTIAVTINSSSFSAYTSGGVATLLSVPTISRSKVSMGVGLKASKVDIAIQATPETLVNAQPMLTAIAQGMFDNAYVSIRRCFMTYGDVTYNADQLNGPAICNLTGSPFGTGDGTILWFAGWVGSIDDIGTLSAKMEVRDLIYYLNRPTPKNLISIGCWHQLFDAGCTLSPSGSYNSINFTQTGTVQAGSTAQVINTNISVGAAPSAPASAPTIFDQGNLGINIAAQQYYAKVTYVSNTGGESLPSPEATIFLAPYHVPGVNSPPSATGAIGWNCYLGDASGDEQIQNGTPIAIGTHYLAPNVGISQSGQFTPAFASTGYWSQGVITFTSGVLSGLSAFVETSNDATGQMVLRVPMIAVPSVGDSFSVQSGCAKSYAICNLKYGNTAHFTGLPFVPTPEQGW